MEETVVRGVRVPLLPLCPTKKAETQWAEPLEMTEPAVRVPITTTLRCSTGPGYAMAGLSRCR